MNTVAIPTHDQELLIRAALGGKVDGAAVLTEWAHAVEFDDLDGGSQRIIPLLYKTHNERPAHPAAGRMRGLYKRSWMRNQVTRHRTATVLTDFESRGIDAIVMKGLSLATTAYGDAGSRPMADADILVRPERFWQAHERLLQTGWKRKFDRPIDPLRPDDHGTSFVDEHDMEVDLHFSVFSAYGHGAGDSGVWTRAVPVSGYADGTRVMSPTDELLHVIVHGLQWDSLPPIRWIPDGVMLLRQSGESIDWDVFIDETVARGLVVPITFGLKTLSDYGASPPVDVLTGLTDHSPTRVERYEFWARQQELRPLRTPTDYMRALDSLGERPSLIGFLTFARNAHASGSIPDLVRKIGRGLGIAGRMVLSRSQVDRRA